MKVKENLEHILKELQDATFKIEEEQIENVLKLIAPDKKIFLTGKGRSGLAAKGFANRLMHLGFQAYVIGEISTPHTKAGDLLIITSGSGETDALVSIAKKAKESGLYLGLVTMNPQSTLGKMADGMVIFNLRCDRIKTYGKLESDIGADVYAACRFRIMISMR